MRKNFFELGMFSVLCEPMNPEAGVYGGSSDSNAANEELGMPANALEHAVHTNPSDKGGIVQHGQDANASALQEANLLDNKLFRKIMDYHVRKYPFYTSMFTKAAQMSWKGHKEAEYPEMGDIKVEARTTAAIGNGTTETVDIDATKMNSNDLAIFRKSYTIFVQGTSNGNPLGGYNEGITAAGASNGEMLMLFVQARSNTSFTVKAINGPAKVAGGSITLVPTIDAGATFTLGAPALAEEEVEVDPINILPTMKNAYLQKKGYSVAITDFFTEAVKEVDWEKDRIKRQALDTYKKLYTTTALFGAKRKFYKQNENGNRICYTQEGFLNQIRMAFELPNGKWTKGALIAICKMLFTTYTDAEEIEVFCGSDAIEGLLNIDWGTGVNQIIYQKDKDYNVEIATFKCTFGVLHFTHELSLTQHHLEKAAIAVPMVDAMRLYRDNGTTKRVDGNKGETGRVEELTKEFFIQDDCFICNAMNSMIIGPADVFSKGYTNGIAEQYSAVDTMPTASATYANKIIYLTKTDTTANKTAGLYKCVNTATSGSATYEWVEYSREEKNAE